MYLLGYGGYLITVGSLSVGQWCAAARFPHARLSAPTHLARGAFHSPLSPLRVRCPVSARFAFWSAAQARTRRRPPTVTASFRPRFSSPLTRLFLPQTYIYHPACLVQAAQPFIPTIAECMKKYHTARLPLTHVKGIHVRVAWRSLSPALLPLKPSVRARVLFRCDAAG